jgi:ferritin-like protein
MSHGRDPMMQFFEWDHLPPFLQEVSRPFADLAEVMVTNLPRNPERTAGLRKLVEAKDCAVRARLYREGT